jgi:hypothetical protein
MGPKDDKGHNKKTVDEATKRSGSTHSGTPNAEDPNNEHSTEHKSGYGGEAGQPRTSSNDRPTEK